MGLQCPSGRCICWWSRAGKSEKEGTTERPEMMLRVSELEKWAEGKTAGLRFRVKEEGWI